MTYDASDWEADGYDRRRDARDELKYTLPEPRTREEEEAEQAYWAWRAEQDPARLAR